MLSFKKDIKSVFWWKIVNTTENSNCEAPVPYKFTELLV
jgi:hypothetical protein